MTSKSKKVKISPENTNRPATRSQQKIQPNVEHNSPPPDNVEIENAILKQNAPKDHTDAAAGGEVLKDSGESEGLITAIEVLEKTIEVSLSPVAGSNLHVLERRRANVAVRNAGKCKQKK